MELDQKFLIHKEIDRTLRTLANLYEKENIFLNIKIASDNDYDMWEYNFKSPDRTCIKYLFVIPKTNKFTKTKEFNYDITNNKTKSTYKIYFVDIFEVLEGKNFCITSKEFFNYLFDLNGYRYFLNKDIDFRSVKELYIDRRVSIDVDEDDIDDNKPNKIQSLFEKWASKDSALPILTLGDRGIGKSWVVKYFCISQFNKHINNPWIVPPAIYLNLRVFSDQAYQNTSLFEAIIYQLRKQYNIKMINDYYIWEALVRAGKIIIVLDGFDEMSQEANEKSMTNHLWEVLNIINKSTRVIITSRENYFTSRLSIYQHFAYKRYQELKKLHNNNEELKAYTETESRLRRYLNIWDLKIMDEDEITQISKKYTDCDHKELSKGVKELDNIKRKSKSLTIENEIIKLSLIPAFYYKLVLYLSQEYFSLIDLFKNCLIYAVIGFNIGTDRAIESIKQKKGNEIVNIPFDIGKKFQILQELAWFMFERNQDSFKLKDLPKYIKNIYGLDYEIIINDLRTQTVLKLKKEDEFEFLSKGVFSFLIASHIFGSVSSKDQIELGINDLGRYDLVNREFNKRILVFLKEYLNQNCELKTTLIKIVEAKLKKDRPYSPWLRYLAQNLSYIYPELKIYKLISWNQNPIYIKEDMVLIPGCDSPQIEPFLISQTEVTNSQFLEFLIDNDNFIERKERTQGFFWERKHKIIKNDKEIHNPFIEVINDYHLLLWVNNKLPTAKENHPVVYISWFAAAMYCNWLSLNKDFQVFYRFIIDENNDNLIKVTFSKNNSGYRLPTASEWDFAAREGNYKIEYPWDKFLNSSNNSHEEGIKYKKKLLDTQPSTMEVKSEKANIYSVYGMIGNVREWVDSDWNDNENIEQEINIDSNRAIKGATWLLGEDGFKFKHINHVFAQNTNLDVGFRIARSLNEDERKIVREAYKKYKRRRNS